jgi:hypothetical protein
VIQGPIYKQEIKVPADDIGLLGHIIDLYGTVQVVNGAATTTLSKKLRTLLAFYILYGYSKSTKKRYQDHSGIREATINSMNNTLKNAKYLIDDEMNGHHKHLSEDMKQIKVYFDAYNKTNKLVRTNKEVCEKLGVKPGAQIPVNFLISLYES